MDFCSFRQGRNRSQNEKPGTYEEQKKLRITQLVQQIKAWSRNKSGTCLLISSHVILLNGKRLSPGVSWLNFTIPAVRIYVQVYTSQTDVTPMPWACSSNRTLAFLLTTLTTGPDVHLMIQKPHLSLLSSSAFTAMCFPLSSEWLRTTRDVLIEVLLYLLRGVWS